MQVVKELKDHNHILLIQIQQATLITWLKIHYILEITIKLLKMIKKVFFRPQ